MLFLKSTLVLLMCLAGSVAQASSSDVLTWMLDFKASHQKGRVTGRVEHRPDLSCDLAVYTAKQTHGFAYLELCSFPTQVTRPKRECIGMAVNVNESVGIDQYVPIVMEVEPATVHLNAVHDEGLGAILVQNDLVIQIGNGPLRAFGSSSSHDEFVCAF